MPHFFSPSCLRGADYEEDWSTAIGANLCMGMDMGPASGACTTNSTAADGYMEYGSTEHGYLVPQRVPPTASSRKSSRTAAAASLRQQGWG